MSVFSGVFRNRVHTLTVTQRLLLPQENVPLAPTLAFGDGDDGFYSEADDNISVALNGTQAFEFTTAVGVRFQGAAPNSPALMNEVGSVVNPTLIPIRGDTNTGIGGNPTGDILSLIAGGVEGVRVTEVGGAITVDIKGDLNAVVSAGAVVTSGGQMVFN